MPYTIRKTNGDLLVILADERTDQRSSSLTLIGKNVSPYGEFYNQNLISLIQNSANVTQPRAPLTGQLWYDTTVSRLKVYGSDNSFRPVSGPFVTETEPNSAIEGDFWIDSVNDQLYFTKDGSSFVLVGPTYSSQVGKTGWFTETVFDVDSNERTVDILYNNSATISVISTQTFELLTPLSGLPSITSGFNLNPDTMETPYFVGTATSALSVNGFSPELFIKNDRNEATTGTLTVLNDSGLYVGLLQNISLTVNSVTKEATLSQNIGDKPFSIKTVNTPRGLYTAIYIDSLNSRVGILTTSPQYPFDVYGNARVQGNILITGTATIATSLQMTGKTLELAVGQVSPNDSFANGGGITIYGSTNHTLSWSSTSNAWESNNNFNLSNSTSSYKINNVTVISGSGLGPGITSATGLVTIGTLTELTVDSIRLNGSTISSVGTGSSLILAPLGTGTVSVSNVKITQLAAPTDDEDASTKKYVDDSIATVGTKGVSLSIDTTNMLDPDNDIITYLDRLLPINNAPPNDVYDLADGTRLRVLCGQTSISITSKVIDIAESTELFRLANTTTSAAALVPGTAATLPGFTVTPTVTYTIREYRVVSGAWNYQGIVP